MKRWEVLYTQSLTKKKIRDVLLENRGIKSEKDKKDFFNPKDPLKIPLEELGINKKQVTLAVERIKKSLKDKEEVVVYGDYDADGVSATAILWEALFNLGLNVLPYIPERFTEGYGLNVESIKSLKEKNPNLSLIITVDHGIVADKKVDLARELGIDVIISDHHQPGDIKPKPLALVHTTKIGGAGVSWVLAREVTKKLGDMSQLEKVIDSLELAAIGTISDQIPLIGPNRSFVKYGLEKLNKTRRVGLLALFETSRIKLGEIGPYQVGFVIAPRINAMGRLEHAIESLRLICTRKPEKAKELARQLTKVNLERQKIVEEVVVHARKSLKGKNDSRVIILAHKSYHEGVIGLAASRLVEEFYKPTIIFSIKDEIAKASARSISGFDIIESIRKTEEFLIEGGGHPMAAGFSIKVDTVEAFSKKFEKISLPLLTDELMMRVMKADLEIPFNAIDDKLYQEVKEFEPTGLGNPNPTFVTKGVNIVDAKLLGQDSKHMKLHLEKDGIEFVALAFGMGELYKTLSVGKQIDVAYSLLENVWNGNRSLELRIKDLNVD